MILYPTKTRLRLLAAVDRGDVHRYGDGRDYAIDGRLLTARIAELQRAGLVELGTAGPVKTPWLITDAGMAVLHGECE